MTRKKNNLICKLLLGSRILKKNQICQQISIKGAISENVFDHLEPNSSSIIDFLTFSGHFDTELHKTVREFEI